MELEEVLENTVEVEGGEIPDGILLKQVLEGNREAQRILVERYQQRAFQLAKSIVRSSEDAEDIVQESFVKAFLSLKNFRGDSSFYTWFYRIVHNMAIDFQRKGNRRAAKKTRSYEELREIRGDAIEQESGRTAESPEDQYVSQESLRELQQALDELSEEHRTAILLREVQGLSYDEIASVTDTTKGTVMSRLHYARKHLSNLVKAAVSTSVKED